MWPVKTQEVTAEDSVKQPEHLALLLKEKLQTCKVVWVDKGKKGSVSSVTCLR